MLRSKGGACVVSIRGMLAAHGRHAHFRFDLDHGKGKKSP